MMSERPGPGVREGRPETVGQARLGVKQPGHPYGHVVTNPPESACPSAVLEPIPV